MLHLHIALWHPKGGTGKTTTALNLAGYLHHVAGKKVVFWDRDAQQSAYWLSKTGIGYGFPVINQPDPAHDDAEIVITDHPPRYEESTRIGKTVVLIPVKPVAIEVAPFEKGRKLMEGKCDLLIPVITRFNAQRSEQVNNLRLDTLSALHDAPVIADRSIYERACGMGTSVFSPALNRLYGVREARAEIAALWQCIEDRLK